jgi:hypothetical protein
MGVNPSLPSWGGWSAPPPTSGGGKAAIHPGIKSIALHIAKRRNSIHMHNTIVNVMVYQQHFM